MTDWLKKLFKITKRVDLRFVGYNEADALLHSGWQIARPEEDNNREGFMVWLELRENSKPPTHEQHRKIDIGHGPCSYRRTPRIKPRSKS